MVDKMEDRNKHYRGALVALPYFHAMAKPLLAKELRRYGWRRELEIKDIRKYAIGWKQSVEGIEYYSLGKIKASQVQDNEIRVKEYWDWVGQKAGILARVPFVELVMVMNGLAHGVVSETSDIDLFVVAREGRVWTVRGWMLWLLKINGLRSIKGKQAKRFSPEFFVDSANQYVSPDWSGSRHLTAFWLSDFVPIVYPQNFPSFWNANKWLAEYLPIGYRSPGQFGGAVRRKLGVIKFIEFLLGGVLGDMLEARCRKVQERIITKNMKGAETSGTVISDSVVKMLWPLNIDRAQDVERQVEKFLG